MQNQRGYVRANHFSCEAWISINGQQWHKAEVENLSSGGAKLYTDMEMGLDDMLQVDLLGQGIMATFSLQAKAQVQRKTPLPKQGFFYGVSFVGLAQKEAVRLDEIARNDRPITGQQYQPSNL